jgi:aspartyl-tRNA(Asn)/glutamyl-tRNA(Gln) amidotransferase subunit B
MQSELGVTADDMQAMANAGVVDLVASTVDAGAPVEAARNWWLGYLAQKANAAEVEPSALGITPAALARVIALVNDGSLSDGLARQVVDGVLETGHDPDAVVAERGLQRVTDTDALSAAVVEAIAAQPDVAEKIRGGKVAAAGALVGAVMKATRGQADAKVVRELILKQLGA